MQQLTAKQLWHFRLTLHRDIRVVPQNKATLIQGSIGRFLCFGTLIDFWHPPSAWFRGRSFSTVLHFRSRQSAFSLPHGRHTWWKIGVKSECNCFSILAKFSQPNSEHIVFLFAIVRVADKLWRQTNHAHPRTNIAIWLVEWIVSKGSDETAN